MSTRASIIIPTSDERVKYVIKQVENSLTKRFGGCSVYRGKGVWYDDGQYVHEKHARVTTTASDDDFSREYIENEAEYVKGTLGEDEVMVEFEDVDVEFI